MGCTNDERSPMRARTPVEGTLMRRLQLIILLCAVALTLAVALIKPLPSRADAGDAPPTPDPTPANSDPIVPQLPVVHSTPVRRPAAIVHRVHRAIHIPLGEKVVKYAKHLIGIRYAYGGSSPATGFDCSGFVRYVYGHFGVRLAHSSFAQFTSGFGVRRGALKPGDLVFFDGLGHVGIYVGNGRFIHAPHTGTRVQIQPLHGWYSTRLDGARRLAGAH